MTPFDPSYGGVSSTAPQLIDVALLQARIAAAARDETLDEAAARADMLRHLKDAESLARAVAARRLEEGMPGLQVARALSRLRDAMLAAIVDMAGVRTGREVSAGSGLAVSAVGGYGRGSLAPYSDLDLMFVVAEARDPWAERVIEIVLYTLWDLGVSVGHATRSVEECIALSRADMTIRTTTLEARYLAGDAGVFETLRHRYWSEVAPSVHDFVEAKLAERAARHAQEENAQYRVEPNIKTGRGGLRDLHALYWIAKYVFRVQATSDLVDAGLLTTAEFQAFERSAAFLWDVRTHLHLLAGRPEERLTFDVQADLARRLRYEDGPGLRAVESFMKAYFTVTREVLILTGIIFAALEMQNAKGRPGRPWYDADTGEPLPDWPDFRLEAGRLALVEDDLFERDGSAMVRLFEAADARQVEVHPNTLRTLQRTVHLIDARVRKDPEANASFLRILSAGRTVEDTLRAMAEASVLGAFVPDYGRVTAMMQFNMYHHYTVDDHLLRTIGQLEAILGGSLKESFPLAHRVAGRIRSRRPLFVAMFLHDIAKGRQEDHSIAGERIARALGPRFGLTESETDAAAWLVRYHLVLSDTAQRRDIFDPKTVSDMVDIIRTRERLRMLLILTIADIKGVGPTTWNRWKAQLLEQLYLEVESVLGGTAPDASRQERAAAVREEVARLLPAHVSRGALERLDTAYWLSFPPETCVRHLRLLAIAEHRMAQGRPFAVLDPVRETRNGVTTVTVVAPDRPGLFAELLGSFSSIGVFLVGAKAFTSVNGIVLDVFEVRDAKSRTIQDPDRFRRLRARMLDRVNEQGRGSAPDPPRLAEREQVFVVPPEVIVDNDASDTATVIEVEHRHRSDLMYRVAAALRDLGLSIVSAHGTHYGELAVDVFYVKDRGGLKVTHQRRIESIETALREAVMRAV